MAGGYCGRWSTSTYHLWQDKHASKTTLPSLLIVNIDAAKVQCIWKPPLRSVSIHLVGEVEQELTSTDALTLSSFFVFPFVYKRAVFLSKIQGRPGGHSSLRKSLDQPRILIDRAHPPQLAASPRLLLSLPWTVQPTFCPWETEQGFEIWPLWVELQQPTSSSSMNWRFRELVRNRRSVCPILPPLFALSSSWFVGLPLPT